MKAIWKFPALVRGTPTYPREERLCLVSETEEIEIRQVDIAAMPLVMTVELHTQQDLQEFRIHGGHLYRSIDEDYGVFEVELDCMDIMSHGFSYVYKEISEEIVDILKSGTENIWPKDAHLNRQGGARELSKSGVKLSSEGEADLRFWRERFRREMDRFLISDGKAWQRVSEPIWSVDMTKGVAILEDASCFIAKRDEFGHRHYANSSGGQKDRMFAVTDMDSVRCSLATVLGNPDDGLLDRVSILVADVFRLDVDRLEMDRLARIAVDHVGKTMTTVKPGGRETFLQVVPSTVTASWMELRDFLKAYDPLDGVPDEIEDIFGRFVEQADEMTALYGPVLVSRSIRDGIAYAFERWDGRSVELSAAPSMPLGI